MATYLNYFIVDGIHYSWLPGNFVQDRANYGLRTNTNRMLDGDTIPITLDNNYYTQDEYQKRKILRQAWTADFTGDAIVDRLMYDHLTTMYTLGKAFWIQYDAHMSRDGAILIPASDNDYTSGATTKHYYAPTYPIAPYGDSPVDRRQYHGSITVDGVVQEYNYRVNSELGVVSITGSISETAIVRMAYTWKAHVIIKSLQFSPADTVAQALYGGSVTFEQVAPNYANDFWYGSLSDATLTLATLQSVASVTSEGWQDTRYMSIPSVAPSVGYSVPSYTSNVGYPMTFVNSESVPQGNTVYWAPYWTNPDDAYYSEAPLGYCWMASPTGGMAGECFSYNIYVPVSVAPPVSSAV